MQRAIPGIFRMAMNFPLISAELATEASAIAGTSGQPLARMGIRKRGMTAPAVAVAPAAAPAPVDVPLSTAGLGGFPYYWQDPATLQFNADTYRWIISAVNGGANPAQLSGLFPNRCITALGSISYSLSNAEQQRLASASADIQIAQADLLTAWKAAFGSTWDGEAGRPIDVVVETIAKTWANPATDLKSLVSASDLAAFLPRAPAEAKTGGILPVLKAYLAAIAVADRWLDMVSRQNGFLQRARAALQIPTRQNGGLTLNNGSIVPAYRVETPLSSILRGLSNQNASLDAGFIAQRNSSSSISVAYNNEKPEVGDPTSFLALETGAGEELIGTAIAAAGKPVSIAARFEGVTRVSFAPMFFDTATLRGWFWTKAIEQAVKQAGPGAGGFGFSPKPPIDFSPQGQFGWLTGLVIARYPSLSIDLDAPVATRITNVVNGDKGAVLKLLGDALMAPGQAANYQASVGRDAGSAKPVLHLGHTVSHDLGSRAYVLSGNVRFIGQ